MSDFRQILSQAKQQIKEVSLQEVQDKLNPDEWVYSSRRPRRRRVGTGPSRQGRVSSPRVPGQKADKILPDKQQPIVVYCAGGARSALAAKTLQDLGYTNVFSMRGGYGMEGQRVSVWLPQKNRQGSDGAIQPPFAYSRSWRRGPVEAAARAKCCWLAQVVWDRLPEFTWPHRASGRSDLWITTL